MLDHMYIAGLVKHLNCLDPLQSFCGTIFIQDQCQLNLMGDYLVTEILEQ